MTICPDCGELRNQGEQCECEYERFSITTSYADGTTVTAEWQGALEQGIKHHEQARPNKTILGISAIRLPCRWKRYTKSSGFNAV